MNTITHEIINYQANIPMKLFYQRIGSVSRHWHSSIEILFVLEGTMTAIIEDTPYELFEGDILLINPHHIHETHSQDCSLIVVQIRLAEFHLNWAIPENIQFDCNQALERANHERYFNLKHLIVMLLKNTSTKHEFSQLSTYTYGVELIRELCLNFKRTSPGNVPHSIKYLNRLKSILDYIHQNYMNHLSLTDIAHREFLTPTYLSAFFEKTMGTPLSAYITKIRLGHAIYDLMNTEDSIEAISAHNGFSSPRAFSSVFRKYYEMLPSEYRRQNAMAAGTEESPLHISETAHPFFPKQQNSYLELEHYDFLSKLTPYIQMEPPQGKITLKADTPSVHFTSRDLGDISAKSSTGKSLTPSFKGFCGISRASELLLPPVRDALIRAQKEIGFEYIKFHGILDDDLMVCQKDKSGSLVYCFTYVDMILDFLIENHLKPMIQFSFMPAALASCPEHTVFQKPVIISPPSDDSEWCRLITAFTMHLLERYGRETVAAWIFTFWNETFNGLSFDFENTDTALRLYQITRQCVKACDKRLRFANTSYSALSFPEDNYDIFLDYARANNCLPDIFIFHFYPVVADSNAFSISANQWKAQDFTKPVALSKDPDIFHKFLDGIDAKLPEAASAPVYITEWNFTPSHREWLNDTCFSACYIVRNLLQNSHKASGFCHWCLTDLHQELPMPDSLFHGGMGLFTQNNVPKPAYFAYTFLNSLLPQIIHEEEGCFITSDGNNFAILLYNYCHFNNLYGHGITFDTTLKNWQRAFPDAKGRAISFRLTGLKGSTYIQTEAFISPDTGSALEEWLAMGSPRLETPEEIRILKGRAAPGYQKKEITVSNQTLHFTARLCPHEIRLIRLIQQM